MAVINASGKFRSYHSKSIPIVPVPKNVRQALNIERMYKNGIAKIEPSKTNSLYDRCYVFEEINYINKDESEKDIFLNQFMSWLKSMSVDFKITIANEFQSIDEFLEKIRGKQNSKAYPQIDKGIKEWTREKLENSNPNVTTLRYLTVSCRANSLEEATILLNALDTTIQQMFAKWRGKILLLNGEERLKCLHALLRPGKKDEEQYIYLDETGKHDWKNDVMPQTIKQYSNFMIFDKTQYVSVLFGWKYSRALKPDELMRSFSYVDFPSFITLDFSPVPADVINEKLVAAAMNNEKSISEEEEAKRKKNIIVSGPSYAKQRKKDEIEGYMDLVNDNDETGFFLNFLFVATAADETTLAQRVEQLKETGKAQGVVISTADYTQLKALNTALPFAGRQVDYMRFFLSSSMVAMQPYFAQDILDPGGYFYGLNLTTKRLIFGNRKLLMNPHAIIVGHTGSGKSVLIKATEIFQTLISTSDDILILDPQNEFKEIVEKYGGSYFDLTPKSKIYINGFEVSDAVFYADKDTKEKFIATQTKYAKSLVAAIMTNILFTQEHATVVSRATRKMLDKIFAQKKLKKQATLRMLREEIKLELENTEEIQATEAEESSTEMEESNTEKNTEDKPQEVTTEEVEEATTEYQEEVSTEDESKEILDKQNLEDIEDEQAALQDIESQNISETENEEDDFIDFQTINSKSDKKEEKNEKEANVEKSLITATAEEKSEIKSEESENFSENYEGIEQVPAIIKKGTIEGISNAKKSRTIQEEVDEEEQEDSYAVENVYTQLSYEGIQENVSLNYSLIGSSLKEDIIVEEPSETYEYRFLLSLGNLVPKQGKEGAIYLNDSKTGKNIYVIPAAYMTDSADNYSENVKMSLEETQEGQYKEYLSGDPAIWNGCKSEDPMAAKKI